MTTDGALSDSATPAEPGMRLLDKLTAGINLQGNGQLARQLETAKTQQAEMAKEQQAVVSAEAAKNVEKAEKAEQAALREEAERPSTSDSAKAKAAYKWARGKFSQSAENYELALALLQKERERSPERVRREANEARATGKPPFEAAVHANLAACRLKQMQWKDAAAAADASLEHGPQGLLRAKVLFRRAQARRSLRQHDAALADVGAAREALAALPPDASGVPAIGRELAAFEERTRAEQAARRQEAERAGVEKDGIVLAQQDEAAADAAGGARENIYYRYHAEGEKEQDWSWWAKEGLAKRLDGLEHRCEGLESVGGLVLRTHGLEGGAEAVEGHAMVRTARGKRSLFFELQLTVRWSGIAAEGSAAEQRLDGMMRLYGIDQARPTEEWRHEIRRAPGAAEGPFQQLIGFHAVELVPRLKLAVQEVLGEIVHKQMPRGELGGEAPPHDGPPKPAPKPRKPAARKGTVDYSKWDDLSDGEEEERIVEVPREG